MQGFLCPALCLGVTRHTNEMPSALTHSLEPSGQAHYATRIENTGMAPDEKG